MYRLLGFSGLIRSIHFPQNNTINLKQSEWFLILGPYKLNGCPLRRINQIYVIATKTKIDLGDIDIPENINDEFFRRQKLKKPRHAEGEIFETAKQVMLKE